MRPWSATARAPAALLAAALAASATSLAGCATPASRLVGVTAPKGSYLSPITSFVALSRDGRTLSTLGVEGPCGQPLPTRLLVSASSQRVALTLLVRGRRYTEEQLRHMFCTTPLFGEGPPPSARLAAPLGDRAVVQGLSGTRIAAYGGATIAVPTVLPAGCTVGPITPSYLSTLSNGPPYSKRQHAGVTWSCSPRVPFPPRFRFEPASTLEFGQWVGWVRSLGLPIELRTHVHGHPALVKVEHVDSVRMVQARSISWREDGQTFVITSYSGLSLSVAHSRAVLSAERLVQIADGLHIRPLPRGA